MCFPQSRLSLTLLTDLTAPMPADMTLDFSVEGFDVGDDAGALAVLLDNDRWTPFRAARCELRGLEPGYHLLRAFLLDGSSGLVIKSPLAYVEAEVCVEAPRPVPVRPFLFGQPSICHISPRVVLRRAEVAAGVVGDFFVHNCEVTEAAHGCVLRRPSAPARAPLTRPAATPCACT